MSTLIDKINSSQQKNKEQLKAVEEFKQGDTVRVHTLIQEGGKERVQIFEGVVIRRNGGGVHETFTVRKISHNVGVERIFPMHSPRVQKVEVKQRGNVRQGRIYYLRDLSGKAARIKEERRDDKRVVAAAERDLALKEEAKAALAAKKAQEAQAAAEAASEQPAA